MKYGSLFGWGIAIYSVTLLAWSVVVTYGLAGTMTGRFIVLLTLIVVASIAGRAIRGSTSLDILPYSLGWVVIAACIDATLSVPSSGWAIYSDLNLWFGYALVAVVPLLSLHIGRVRAAYRDH